MAPVLPKDCFKFWRKIYIMLKMGQLYQVLETEVHCHFPLVWISKYWQAIESKISRAHVNWHLNIYSNFYSFVASTFSVIIKKGEFLNHVRACFRNYGHARGIKKRARTSTKRAKLKTLKIIHQSFHLVSEGTNQHLKGYP